MDSNLYKNGNSEKIVHDKELGINKKTVLKKKKTPFHYIRKGQMTFISVMSLKVLSKDPVLFKLKCTICKKVPHIKYH